jgi:hypothetical protein
VGSNPTLSAMFLVPVKLQYYRRLATFFEHLKGASMASVYARFRGSDGWEYQKVGGAGRLKMQNSTCASRTHKENAAGASRSIRPKRREKNASGVTVAAQAASQGLTVAEFRDLTNAGRTSVKVAIERFIKLHRNDRPKTIQQYENALNHLLANLPSGVRFVKDLATADALDAYLQTLEQDNYAKKTIETRMGVIFSLLKDYVRETGVEHPSKLVSLPELYASVRRPIRMTRLHSSLERWMQTTSSDISFSFTPDAVNKR